ncbi:O-antigen ligase family protein [Roseateles chitinivorans]|uniref:O-antigen ligase family protein n=1 Tax=Roseateles chitinivorans TaxID=2917965 RepID=UPI003D6712C8
MNQFPCHSVRCHLHRWLPLALAVLLWAVPCMHSALPTQLNPHDFARLVQLGVLLMAAAVWTFSLPTRSHSRIFAKHWPHVVLGLLVAASCVHAAHPLVAAREVAVFVGLLLLALQLSRGFAEPDVRDRFLDLITIGAAVYGVIWSLTLLIGAALNQDLFAPWEVIFGFDNARFLNHVQSISLPLAGVVLLRPAAPRWLRAAAAIALITGGAILSLYLARASILGLTVAAIVTVTIFGRLSWRYVLTMVATLGSGAAAVGLLWLIWLQHSSAAMTDGILNSHFRGFLVGQAIDLFASSPWLGVGPMHFSNTVNLVAAHPHNVYAQVIAEYGLPATLLIVWLAFNFLRRAFVNVSRLSKTQPVLAAALTSATVAVLVDSAFSGNWVMPISQMWIAVLAAFLLAVDSNDAHAPVQVHQAQPRIILRGLVLSVMAAFTIQAVTEARDDIPHIHTGESMKKPIGEQFLAFRFWSYGWF